MTGSVSDTQQINTRTEESKDPLDIFSEAEKRMFTKPLTDVAVKVLQDKFRAVNTRNSEELAMQYMDMEIGRRYAATKLSYCPLCQAANHTAWRCVMFRIGKGPKPAPTAAQLCRYHPAITFQERVAVAVSLDHQLLYLKNPVDGAERTILAPVLHIDPVNGA